MAGTSLKRINSSSLSLLRLSPHFHMMQRASSAIFYEKNKKGSDADPPKTPLNQKIMKAINNFVPETRKWCGEQKEAYTTSPMLEVDHGNYEVIFRFNDKASVDSWIVTADRDNAGGKSTANFTFTKNRTGLFHGHLCKEVPKDGITKYAGYANITCSKPMKSFQRETHWDWSLFNCILLRVRGDGRPYSIVIGCDFYYDMNWLNRWSYPLYTRGGPYWQMVKIPFAKFFVNHHGRIQDRQEYPPLSIVNTLGITVGDTAEGPYLLEIDSIALMYDVNLSGKHAYELYEMKNYEAQT